MLYKPFVIQSSQHLVLISGFVLNFVLQIYNRVHEREENFGLVHDKDTICSAFALNLSLQMLSLTHLSVFRPGQIMIFNSDLHRICPHLHSEANAQLSYLSSGQMSYLSLSQIPTNVTKIIFEPHLDCICLTSNLFFRPVIHSLA